MSTTNIVETLIEGRTLSPSSVVERVLRLSLRPPSSAKGHGLRVVSLPPRMYIRAGPPLAAVRAKHHKLL